MKKTVPKTKVFVGMSGGVDSSVAALLLKKQGYEVTGCFIKGWYPHFAEASRGKPNFAEITTGKPASLVCTWRDDRRDAVRVCAKLGIPFVTIDAEKEYKKEVVDYMLREYKTGRTPNPDIMCNKSVKFGVFLKKALAMGANYVATGHYVGLQKSEIRNPKSETIKRKNNRGRRSLLKPACNALHSNAGREEPELVEGDGEGVTLKSDYFYNLHIAKDLNKDQSYFLWTLNQEQLKHCLFPLGDLTKPEVRKIARKNNLITADKEESMGVCFIGEFKMEDFLKKYIKPKKGDVVTANGAKVGEHNGVQFYTIGQRHGIGTPEFRQIRNEGGAKDTPPYFIVAKDIKKNLLIVADEINEKLFYKKEVEIDSANWISGVEPDLDKTYLARIRYRQLLQKCKISSKQQVASLPESLRESLRAGSKEGKKYNIQNTIYKIQFSVPQRAVTPGQSLVIYDNKGIMQGGGIIE